jgi:prepilin-type N-terminal cleavage/methylation domain-containing protein
MKPVAAGEDGFTLVELLVAMFVFSLISVGMYQLLFSASRSSQLSRNVVKTSEEARLGFNRLVRDTREGREIRNPSSTSFNVQIDFNGNGTIEATPADPVGSYESITFTFNESVGGLGTITATAGGVTEVLMTGVDCVRKSDNTCNPVFTYRSSRLEYDSNTSGITSTTELDAASGVGNNNGLLDGSELGLIDTVAFALRIEQGTSRETFYAQAQLRNLR